MFAQGAFEIGWEKVTFVNVAANFAHPTSFAVLGFFGWLRFGLDVLLVIVVGHRGLVGKHLGIEHIGNEHRVRTEVDALGDATGQVGVGVLWDVKYMVDGTVFGFAVGKLVHLAPRLEAEMLKDEHWCLSGQHTDVEHTGILNEIMGVVALVDRHGNLQGVACDLDHRVYDTAVVDVVVIGGQHVETVADIE